MAINVKVAGVSQPVMIDTSIGVRIDNNPSIGIFMRLNLSLTFEKHTMET